MPFPIGVMIRRRRDDPTDIAAAFGFLRMSLRVARLALR